MKNIHDLHESAIKEAAALLSPSNCLLSGISTHDPDLAVVYIVNLAGRIKQEQMGIMLRNQLAIAKHF